MKKHVFKKGEFIGNTFLKYICEAGNDGKHRYIMTYCDLCGSITRKRLDNVLKGRVKSCGCEHNRMIEEGVLSQLSVTARRSKPYLQKGGRRWVSGYCIIIRKQDIAAFTKKELVEAIIEYLKEVGDD